MSVIPCFDQRSGKLEWSLRLNWGYSGTRVALSVSPETLQNVVSLGKLEANSAVKSLTTLVSESPSSSHTTDFRVSAQSVPTQI